MSERGSPPSKEVFAKWVRQALNRLYDSPYLQAHPLSDVLSARGGGATLHRSQSLRRLLLESIQAVRPGQGVPAQSPDWRAYRILELRYIEGLSPQQVMDTLGLGRSQFFRDQARVLAALVDALWERYGEARAPDPGFSVNHATREEMVLSETERLCSQATWEAVDVSELLENLRPVLVALAEAAGIPLRLSFPRSLTIANADRVMLRQAVLNLLTFGLEIARGGQMEVTGYTWEGETGIRVLARGPALASSRIRPEPGHELSLDICSQLTAAMGGELSLSSGSAGEWEAHLAWPVAVPAVLLVVDDNERFVDLFRRYLAGHNWQVVGAGDVAEARKIIAETCPTVITLDVMMPREDGWEFLLALKSDDRTREIPIVVCSVLEEPQVALTLGAETCLTKPVTQQALLRAIAPWHPTGANVGPAN